MDAADELTALEADGWEALSTDGAAATEFYGRVLDGAVVMLLPGGMRLTDRDAILKSMGGVPWTSFALEDPQVLGLGADGALVVYGVVAEREGATYSALVSSAYVRRDGAWRLAFHQQTLR
ncbi:MAG TPA: nuclear transport factor 2 family protein [Solirubrobacteraceae bacterium]|nr:nuclear transport factor 2 family protein [Solirubrobacteraceae bacterium]